MRRVSDILRAAGLRGEWPSRLSEEDRAWYLQRGTFVHKATELYDRGQLDWNTLDERIKPYVLAWRKFRTEAGGVALGIEVAVKSIRYGYCGTLDRIIYKSSLFPKGKLLIDIKTNLADPATAIQTSAYALAWGKHGARCKRGSVSLLDTGNYKYTPYDDDSGDRAAWMACLALSAWKQKRGI